VLPCGRARRRRLDDAKFACDGTPRQHPADERCRHVAAADERGRHRVRFRHGTRAEDRSPDPHERRAFRDRILEIGRHSHRQRVHFQSGVAASLEAFAQMPESRAPHRDVRRGLGDAHDAAQPQPGIAATLVAKLTARSGSIPLFDASPLTLTWMQTSSGGIPSLRVAASRVAIFSPVNRLHPVERRCGKPSLVALQGSDQVPANIRQIAQARHLRRTLLHVVFAEIALSERMHRPDGSGRKRLAHRDEPHAVGLACGCFGRTRNSRAHGLPRLLVLEHNRLSSTANAALAR
jgi:hypothetical protein